MRFNNHSNLAGQHAFLSASKPHWLNYSDEKLDQRFLTAQAAQRGSELHEFAAMAIRLGQKLRGDRRTISMYVNDCIGWGMTPEQVLFYSINAFGTTDAISFRKNVLRLSDLKTGVTPANKHQLDVYAGLFCLEYGVKPAQIRVEQRIYQNDDVLYFDGDPDFITHVMDRIVVFDKRVMQLRMEEL